QDGEGQRATHGALGQALLRLELLVGRPLQRPEPERHRLGQRGHAPGQRHLGPPLGPFGGGADLGLDVTLGGADGNRPRRRPPHHHAFHDRLPADVAGLGHLRHGGPAGYFFLAAGAAFLAAEAAFWAAWAFCTAAVAAWRRWKRSTRPAVSTTFCLPV